MYRESINFFHELNHRRGIARLLEYFACLASGQLEAERSLRLAGAAAALRQNIGASLTPAEQTKLETSLGRSTPDIDQQGTRDGLVRRLVFASREGY
jgi:hypothetical protein